MSDVNITLNYAVVVHQYASNLYAFGSKRGQQTLGITLQDLINLGPKHKNKKETFSVAFPVSKNKTIMYREKDGSKSKLNRIASHCNFEGGEEKRKIP